MFVKTLEVGTLEDKQEEPWRVKTLQETSFGRGNHWNEHLEGGRHLDDENLGG